MKRITLFLLIVTMVSLACRLEIDSKSTAPGATATSPGVTATLALNIPTPTATARERATVTALQSLWVRSRGYYGSPIRGVLRSGDIVTLESQCNSRGWIKISVPDLGISGWVNSQYLDGGCNSE